MKIGDGGLPDVFSPEKRSEVMSRIRGRDTRLEVVVRKALHARGFRYRLNRRDVPGAPDFLLCRHRVAGFAHGCFWHGHACRLFKQPGGKNAEFWAAKISRNVERDGEVAVALRAAGWRRLVVWECALRGTGRIGLEAVAARASHWILGSGEAIEIRGTQ